MAENPLQPGGFLLPHLPSPAPSNVSQASNTSNLPHPRSRPLRPGSVKEDTARRYVETRLLHISRRYTKKFQPVHEEEEVRGYESMVDVAKDLGDVIDVLWFSGTPSLQIPYLLNVALSTSSYLPSFPAAPNATFSLLRKLDHAFASLLKGEDISTGEPLPGFENGMRGGMSVTDMVRCKSLVESTRVLVVDVMGREDEREEEGLETGSETEGGESSEGWGVDDDGDDGLGMDVARVYQDTIEQLNVMLGGGSSYDPGAA